MTPEHFYAIAVAWLEVIAKLALPAATCVGAWLGFLAYIKGKLNEKRLNGHSDTIQTLLLNAAPPVQTVVKGDPVSTDGAAAAGEGGEAAP
jgi:hypothetical protein